MPFTTLAGLRIKAPTRGTRNWDAVVLTDTWTPISQHQHTGDPDGLQIPTGGIADNAITGAKIRLSNEEYLRSRNAADDGDINIVRVNSSDVVELGVTSMDVQVAGQLLLPTEVTTTAGAIRYNSATKKYLGNDGTSEISIGGDDSWTMSDGGSGQITFNSGSRTVNGIVKDLSSDVTTNATVVAITDDTLTVVDASNGFLYEASDTIRIFTFYDIVDGEFSAIGNSASDTKWDYRNGDASFNINLSRYVPVGYVDVTASGSPGTVSVVITNFPVQSWTTFNNTAAAGPWATDSWTATLTNGTNLSVTRRRFRRVGNAVEFQLLIDASGAGAGGTLEVALPVDPTAAGKTNFDIVGSGIFDDTSTGLKGVSVQLTASNTITFSEDEAEEGALEGADLNTGDSINVFGQYEIDAAEGYSPISVAFPDVSDLQDVKYLSADLDSTDNGIITDFSSSTLVVGRTYRVKGNLRNVATGNDTAVSFTIYNESTASGTVVGFASGFTQVSGNINTISFETPVFTADDANVVIEMSSLTAGNLIEGNGTPEESYVIIEEVPQSGIGVLIDRGTGRLWVEDGNGHGSTNTVIRRFTTTTLSTSLDVAYADSATLGATFTILNSGAYSVSYGDRINAGSGDYGISVNSTQLTTSIAGISDVDRFGYAENTGSGSNDGGVTWVGKLVAGDVVRAHTDGNMDSTNLHSYFKIERIL